jgi:hypothetical protein
MIQPSPRENFGVQAIGIALIFTCEVVPILCLLAGCPGSMSSTSSPSGSAGASESCQDRVRYIPQHSNGVACDSQSDSSIYEQENGFVYLYCQCREPKSGQAEPAKSPKSALAE